MSVLIHTQLPADAVALRQSLSTLDVTLETLDWSTLMSDLDDARASLLLLTSDGLDVGRLDALAAHLACQPLWSDLPVLLLGPRDDTERFMAYARPLLESGYTVVVLERPVSSEAFLSVVRSLLRARQRQRQVHVLLEHMEQARGVLEQRVRERGQALQRRGEQITELAEALTSAERVERDRVARLLHDELQQELHVLSMQLLLAERTGMTQAHHARLRQLVEQVIGATRRLVVDLTPPLRDDDDLSRHLRWLGERMYDHHALTVVCAFTEAPLRVEAWALRELLFGVARELLFNVAKHAGVSRARLTAGIHDGVVELCVADEGEGFDPQAARASKREDRFGLFSQERRLALLGGALTVRSAPGQGTRVWARVPLNVKAARADEGGEGRDGSRPGSRPAAGLRVLVVDPLAMVREGLVAALREAGVDVVGQAEAGHVALELARALQPDVVILDLALPDADPLAVVRQLALLREGTRVIALTMDTADATLGARARDAGVAAVLGRGRGTQALLRALTAPSSG